MTGFWATSREPANKMGRRVLEQSGHPPRDAGWRQLQQKRQRAGGPAKKDRHLVTHACHERLLSQQYMPG